MTATVDRNTADVEKVDSSLQIPVTDRTCNYHLLMPETAEKLQFTANIVHTVNEEEG